MARRRIGNLRNVACRFREERQRCVPNRAEVIVGTSPICIKGRKNSGNVPHPLPKKPATGNELPKIRIAAQPAGNGIRARSFSPTGSDARRPEFARK